MEGMARIRIATAMNSMPSGNETDESNENVRGRRQQPASLVKCDAPKHAPDAYGVRCYRIVLKSRYLEEKILGDLLVLQWLSTTLVMITELKLEVQRLFAWVLEAIGLDAGVSELHRIPTRGFLLIW